MAFSHTPGFMFLCDVPTPSQRLSPNQRPLVLQISEQPLFYSVLGEKTMEIIHQLYAKGIQVRFFSVICESRLRSHHIVHLFVHMLIQSAGLKEIPNKFFFH